MNRGLKNLLIAVAAGIGMSLVLWLFVSERSPAFHYFLDQPEAGFAMLVLNFPALFLARLASSPTEITYGLYALCFLQWFAIGLTAPSLIWRNQTTLQKNALR